MPDEIPNETPAETPPAAAPPVADPVVADPAVDPEAAKKAAAAEVKRKLKLKVDGQEEEDDEDKVVGDAQKWRSSTKRFDQLAAEKKAFAAEQKAVQQEREQVKSILNALKDPKALRQIIEAVGADPTELLGSIAQDLTAEAQMTPQERAYAQREQQLAERERKLQELEEAKEAEKIRIEEEKFEGQVVEKMQDVLRKLGFDEKNKPSQLVIQRIATRLRTHLDAGTPIHQVNSDDLLGELDSEYATEHGLLWGKLPAEKLYKRLGDAKVRELAEYASKQIPQGPPSPTSQRPGTVPASPKDPPEAPQSLEEYEALMEKYRLDLLRSGN